MTPPLRLIALVMLASGCASPRPPLPTPPPTTAAPPPRAVPTASAPGCATTKLPEERGEAFAWLPENDRAVAIIAGSVRLIAAASSAPGEAIAKAEVDAPSEVLVSKGGAYLAIVGKESVAVLRANGTPVKTLPGRADGFDAEGRRFLAHDAHAVTIVELANGETSALPLEETRTATFAPHGGAVAIETASDLRFWDPQRGVQAYSAAVPGAATFSPDGAILAVRKPLLALPHGVDLLDTSTLRPRGTPLMNTRCDDTAAIAWSPDSAHLVVASRASYVCTWDVAGPRLVHDFDLPVVRPPQGPAPPARWIAYTPNGEGILGAAAIEGEPDAATVDLYRAATGDRLSSLGARLPPVPLPGGALYLAARDAAPVVVSPDLRVSTLPLRAGDGPLSRDATRAIGRREGALRVLDVATGAVVATLEDTADPLERLSFSPSGAFVAGFAAGSILRVWDARTGALRFVTRDDCTARQSR